MKCFVKLPTLRSTLGDTYLCHKNDRVFVSHMNSCLDLHNILWNSDDVPREYEEFIIDSGLPD